MFVKMSLIHIIILGSALILLLLHVLAWIVTLLMSALDKRGDAGDTGRVAPTLSKRKSVRERGKKLASISRCS